MTRAILEVDEQYNPSFTGGFEFFGLYRINTAMLKIEKKDADFRDEISDGITF